jgi:hypothetical protein
MTEDKALSYVPQIQAAHDKAVNAQQSGYQSALQAAIEAGELLLSAKDAVGTGNWAKWRDKHLPSVPQVTASLYMRLAKNKDKFNQRAVNNGVVSLRDRGELSIRKAAALIADTGSRGGDGNRKGLKELAPEELITQLKKLRGDEYLRELMEKLGKALRPSVPPSMPSAEALRRPITPSATTPPTS